MTTLTELTNQAIQLMRQKQAIGQGNPGYQEVHDAWLAIQKQIAAAGNHSMSKSAARIEGRATKGTRS